MAKTKAKPAEETQCPQCEWCPGWIRREQTTWKICPQCLKHRQPTKLGQTILNTLCDELAKHRTYYWTLPLERTEVVIDWLARKLNRTNRSIAGAVSDLLEKKLLKTIQLEDSDGFVEDIDYLTLAKVAWLYWPHYSEAELVKHNGGETLAEWFDWDGVDGTELGTECAVIEEGIFGKKRKAR